jgi:hypothetical protein
VTAPDKEWAPDLTITMSSQRPIRIRKATWPILASSSITTSGGLVATLTVRERNDFQKGDIVYGVLLEAPDGGRGQGSVRRRRGELLLATSMVPASCREIATSLLPEDPQAAIDLAVMVIAKLPAESVS